MSYDNQNDIQPKPAEEVTAADIQRLVTRDESRDATAGIGQDLMAIRSLQAEVDIWQAKADHYISKGESVQSEVTTQLNAKSKSLAWQTQRYDANTAENGGVERRDALSINRERDASSAALEQARETNMRASVTRVMEREGISKFEAMQIINQEIALDGERAERKYLPQYSSIKERLMAQGQAAPTPSAAATPAAPGPDLAQMRETIRRAKAAGADTSDSEALLKYLGDP